MEKATEQAAAGVEPVDQPKPSAMTTPSTEAWATAAARKISSRPTTQTPSTLRRTPQARAAR